jgi:hypothetical protein
MPESDNTPNEKFRVIIYHGHIHIFSTSKENKEKENIQELQNLEF